MILNIREKKRHVIAHESKDAKFVCINLLRYLKHKTGFKFGEIIIKALIEYKLFLDKKDKKDA